MSVLTHIGDRLYEFETFAFITKARELYAQCTGTQSEFEECMENAGIEFYITNNENLS